MFSPCVLTGVVLWEVALCIYNTSNYFCSARGGFLRLRLSSSSVILPRCFAEFLGLFRALCEYFSFVLTFSSCVLWFFPFCQVMMGRAKQGCFSVPPFCTHWVPPVLTCFVLPNDVITHLEFWAGFCWGGVQSGRVDL